MSATDEAREVSYEEALSDPEEGGAGTDAPDPGEIDQAQPQQAARPRPGGSLVATEGEGEGEPAVEDKPNDLEILAHAVKAKEWTFGETGDEEGGIGITKTYIQRELSLVGKLQWFGLVGEILDDALTGENKLSLNSLLTPPAPREKGAALAPQDFRDADTFVHAVGKLFESAPDFVYKSVCIWLDVPDYEWDMVHELMKRSPSIGGMSDDMFEEIFNTFIDQNYGQMVRFFQERFPRLRGRWQARQKEAQERRKQSRKR